jgi:hypothetical protein
LALKIPRSETKIHILIMLQNDAFYAFFSKLFSL